MKKTTTSNPLKFFNDAKAARNKSFSKSLPKAQNGLIAGPFDENTSKWLDKRYPSTALKFEGPIDPKEELKIRNKEASDNSYHMAIDNITSSYAVDKQQREKDEAALRGNWHINRFNSEPMRTKEDVENPNKISKPTYYKKGGAITKMQKGGTITIKTISPNDPYEVAKRKLQQDKLAVTKKLDLSIATAKRKREEERNKNLKLKVQLTGKMAKGGATKATKFAALAPPYNKATFADRIVGAKKNKKK